jgi:hypothetical protein
VTADELGAGNITLVITASAREGAADLLVADGAMGTILESIRLPCSPRCLRLALPSMWECPAGVNVVTRTAGQESAATVILDDVGLERMDDLPVNPALMPMAPEQAAPQTMTSGTAAFEDQLAATINTARRAWLASLPLQWQGQHVVDLGCGIGLFAGFFLDRDARYTGVDGRVDNVAAARAAVPGATFLQADARDINLPQVTGIPDVVLAIGLLYHLDDPLGFVSPSCSGTRSRWMPIRRWTALVAGHRFRGSSRPCAASDSRPSRRHRHPPITPTSSSAPMGMGQRAAGITTFAWPSSPRERRS